jgi:DNA polymerase elongation subunit (family B)
MGPIVRIHTVHDELDGILKFFDLIRELDPCIITGHNIISFDNSYILERYRLLVM